MGKKILPLLSMCCVILLIVNGCIKKQTIKSMDSQFRQVKSFADDTNDNDGFLSEDLAKKAAKILQPIYFEYDSYVLTPKAIGQMVLIAKFLKENARLRILIEGHCDERGSSEYNIGLGEARARVIRDYLVAYGISVMQLEMVSLGREVPAQSGCHDEPCHSLNRRGEFKPMMKK